MSGVFEYSQPLVVESPEDCYFYHRFDLPGLGTVGGDWDLRSCIDAYLGNYRFSGKRVLDVGTASGFLTFEMEKRGATVVSFDMEDGGQWNVVPHFRAQDALQKTLVRLPSEAVLQRCERRAGRSERDRDQRQRE